MKDFNNYDDFDENLKEEYDEDNLSKKLVEIIGISKDMAKIYKALIYDNDNKLLLRELSLLKKQEQCLYQDLELDMHKALKIKTILREFENIYGLSINNSFGASCNYDIEDLWAYRIEDKVLGFSKDSLEKVIKLINNGDIYISKDDMQDIKTTVLDDALSLDFVRAFIYFMDEEINKCEDGNLKQYLIETKYKLIYTTDKLDDTLIKENTKPKSPLYINFGLTADLLSIPRTLMNSIQEDIGLTYLDYAVSNIELLNEYSDEKELQMIFSIYFRAGLALMYNCENYEAIIEDIKLDIDDGINGAFSCLEEYLDIDNPDKEKCKYLSFYKPENY